MEKYLHGLNEKQEEAVLATEGPLLIVAGAGAGKTKTITHRIAHLIAKGVAPRSILAITFTNKAAKEMRERVEAMLPKEGGMPFVSTFHSLGVHILKHHGSVVGIPRFFAIYDKSDGKKIVKDALVAKNYDPKQFDPAKILGVISKEKGNFVSLSAYEEKVGNEFFPKVVATIWREYERRLKEEAALDFDDLLLVTATLLQKYPEVLMYYQDLWKYIHIDEYQDTNQVQYMIATLLAREHKNICAVGDTDQNIYSWRGAEIKNILHFEKDYPNAKIILLEENYRSTQTILAVANQIIKKNLLRIDKNLFTRNGVGERVGLFEAWSETHEAEFVVLKIQELMKTGVSPKEIAVLYRANFQSRALEEAFLSHTLPYQMVGTKFFERKEVKDVLSYIRASLNPQSLSDLKRIINSPTRGIGKTTAEKYFTGLKDSLPKAAKDKIANFESTLVKVRAAVATMKPSELIKYVIKVTGIEDELKAGGEEGLERLENIRELVTLGSRYDGSEAENGIEALLSDAALASDQDSLVKNEDAVKLMTVHASKGLEFDYVFVTGLEQDLFPHQRLDQGSISQDSSEEERRLFYVALTRARKKIFLTYSTMRTIFGSRQVNVPSEFILDIDPSFVEQEYILRDEDGRNPRIDIEF